MEKGGTKTAGGCGLVHRVLGCREPKSKQKQERGARYSKLGDLLPLVDRCGLNRQI